MKETGGVVNARQPQACTDRIPDFSENHIGCLSFLITTGIDWCFGVSLGIGARKREA